MQGSGIDDHLADKLERKDDTHELLHKQQRLWNVAHVSDVNVEGTNGGGGEHAADGNVNGEAREKVRDGSQRQSVGVVVLGILCGGVAQALEQWGTLQTGTQDGDQGKDEVEIYAT